MRSINPIKNLFYLTTRTKITSFNIMEPVLLKHPDVIILPLMQSDGNKIKRLRLPEKVDFRLENFISGD